MTINILKTESFLPLGPAIRKPVAEKPYIPEQVRPGVFKDQQGRLYTEIFPNCPQKPEPPLGPMPTFIGFDLGSDEHTHITVYELSRELGIKASVVMVECMRFGQQVTLNQCIDPDLAELVRNELKPTPLPTLLAVPNALSDGWIDCGYDMPDAPEGTYQLRGKFANKSAWTPGENDGFTGKWSLRRNVHSSSQIASHQYRLIQKASE